MKLMLILSSAVLITLIQISCGENCSGSNCEEHPDADINIIDDTADMDSSDAEVADTDENAVTTDEDGCSGDDFNPAWAQPEDSWKLWGYLKIMGEVSEKGDVAATFTDGKIKLTETITELTGGSFSNAGDSIIGVNAYTYEFINTDENAGTATVDYRDAFYSFSQELIPAMKEAGISEAGFGASVFFRRTFVDIEFDTAGTVKAQYLRKGCYLGIGKTEKVDENGNVYDVPVGDIYGSFCENEDGSAGQYLRMMFKNEFTDDESVMLEYFNTRADGTVAKYGDEDFSHLCTCYEPDGKTEIDCWKYDGPGGAEERPDYVPEENDDDTVSDEDSVII